MELTKSQALERVSSLSRKIDKGELDLDSWKWQRAKAMAAAADVGATQREIAKAAGLTLAASQRHLKVGKLDPGTWSSYSDAFDDLNGFDRDAAQARTDRSRAARVFAEQPLEHVERIIDQLPPERKRAVAAAAGHAYLKARQDFDEHEASLTPAQKKEREAAAETITHPIRRAVSAFTSMSVAQHLAQAKEDLREIIDGGGPTQEQFTQIESEYVAFGEELEVARATAGAWEIT